MAWGQTWGASGFSASAVSTARLQLLIVDRDQLGRIAGLGPGLGDDHGDMIADMAHEIGHQRGMRRLDHGRAVLAVDLPAAGKPALAVGGVIGAGEDGDDARGLLGLGRVDASDLRRGMGRAQDIGVGLAMPVDVVGIGSAAGEEAEIFFALDGGADALLSHGAAPHRAGAGLHGLDDVVIAGAAADVAFQPLAHVLLAGIAVTAGEIHGAHDHARGAEAALQPVMLAEGGLHRMQRAIAGQPFDGGHLGAIGLDRQQGAGFDRLAVDMDDAGAALAGVAADMGAGQAELLAQELHQQRSALDSTGGGLAVHRHGYSRHSDPPLLLGAAA